jgi:hypothetical protein
MAGVDRDSGDREPIGSPRDLSEIDLRQLHTSAVGFAGRDGPKTRGTSSGRGAKGLATHVSSGRRQALRDQFLETMRHDAEVPPFDEQARWRVGQLISSAARKGSSEFSYSTRRPRR